MKRNYGILVVAIFVTITCLSSTTIRAKSATGESVSTGPQTPSPLGPATRASSATPIPMAATPDAKKQPWTKSFAEFSQGVAFVAAALFFLWKLAAGYLAINLTLNIETRRYRRSETCDNLVIKVLLDKGDRESAVLESVILEIEVERTIERSSSLDSPINVTKCSTAFDRQRIELTEDTKIEIKNGVRRAIRLSPGETATFERMIDVPTASAVKISAQVSAKTGFLLGLSPTSYSRGTLISVPADRYKANTFSGEESRKE